MDYPLKLISVPLITMIVYGTMYVYKHLVNGNEKFIRLIPALSIIIGAVLGVVAFYVAKDIMPASDVLTSLLIGGASGLAATGSHQLLKQLSNKDCNDNADEEKDEESNEN